MSDADSPAEPSLLSQLRRRRSRLPRWLMVLIALATGAVVTCGAGWVVLLLLFSPSQTKVPAEVETIARRVAPLRVPPQFQPAWGWEADHSVAWIQIARFDHSAGRGLLLIGELHLRPIANPQEVDQLRNLLENSSPDMRLIAPRLTEERKLIVRGRKAQFEIVEGEDRASTTKLRQVTGTFPGREGTAILILQGEEDYLSNEAIDDLLQSLAEADVPK
ncbi:MAG: hypothetical protein AABP62_28805 [Planctomycetota bacterium]